MGVSMDLVLLVAVVVGCVSLSAAMEECYGGQTWNYCGACDKTCENKYPMCITSCTERCECPYELPIWHNGQCIQDWQCPNMNSSHATTAMTQCYQCKHSDCDEYGTCNNGCMGDMYYTSSCHVTCPTTCTSGKCQQATGACTHGCTEGFKGPMCEEMCHQDCYTEGACFGVGCIDHTAMADASLAKPITAMISFALVATAGLMF